MAAADPLAHVLSDLRLSEPHGSRLVLSAPWGASIPGSGFPGLYVVQDGSMWLRLEGADPLALSAGDVVVLPRGASHALVSESNVRAVRVDEFCDHYGASRTGDVEGGGGGRSTTVDTFCFRLASPNARRLLSVVSDTIVLRGSQGAAWTSQIARALGAMLHENDDEREPEIRRLGEVLFATGIRLACRAPSGSVDDAAIAMALVLIHGDIAAPWTVASLARRVGVSRSSFHERFSRVIGEAPGDYVTRARMEEADHLLRTPDTSVDEVAEAVGYASRSSFAFAFRRAFGTSPRSPSRRATLTTRRRTWRPPPAS